MCACKLRPIPMEKVPSSGPEAPSWQDMSSESAVVGCILLLALSSCTAPTPPPARTPVVLAESPPPPRPVAPEPARQLPSAHVEATGCTFQGPTEDPFILSVDAARPEANFALVRLKAPVQLTLADRPEHASSIRLHVFALDLDVQVPADGFPLHAKAPLALGGLYDPKPFVRLRWSPRADGNMGLHVHVASSEPRFVGDAAKDVGCDEIGLDARAELPRRQLPPQKSAARATETLLLSATPGGPVVAQAEQPKREVSVHGSAHGATEISFDAQGLWHGWVPARSLVKIPKLSEYGYGSGSGRSAQETYAGLRCPKTLPLFLRKNATVLARVGVVRANEHVALAAESTDSYRALLPEQRTSSRETDSLKLQPDYELVVEQAPSHECVDEARSAH